MVLKEVNLMQFRPFDWRYLLGFFVVVLIAMLCWGLATSVSAMVRGFARPVAQEPVGVL